ncbi:MAG: hypothetical protein LQ340_000616 [Diploschistes diacapsis]|nr:MAG: hypothetical protein LQ340_000616 [Diploschistes diacapsis]
MASETSTSIPHNGFEDIATSPRSTSLAAAATINAGHQAQEGRNSPAGSGRSSASYALRRTPTNERRRSNIAMNINLNDPALPGPGELQSTGDHRASSQTFRTASPQTISRSPSMADPHHHHRAPSIGELHQELEQEQEAQVNRLLQTIRQQQSQIQALQAQTGTPALSGTDASPTSERSFSFTSAVSNARARSPVPISIRSRRPSQATPAPVRGLPMGVAHSHNIPATEEYAILPSGAPPPIGAGGSGGKDETAYYQAEAQNLTRENQMLKLRIKELEKQLAHSNGSGLQSTASSHTIPPSSHSNLALRALPDGATAEGAAKAAGAMDTD